MHIICLLLIAYGIVLLARILMGWVAMLGRPPSGFVRQVDQVLFVLTEPVLRPVRGLLPPIRLGGMGLDLSAVIVFIILGILQTYICR